MNFYNETIEKIKNICENGNSEYSIDEPLKNHTTFKVGGNCKIMFYPSSAGDILKVLEVAQQYNLKFAVIGNGSNIIASDSGFDGIIIEFGHKFADTEIQGNTISCKSGLSLNSLCLTALKNSLTGLEFAWGIPGTVGGALYMNAGAYGGEMSDIVMSAEFIDTKRLDKGIMTIDKSDMKLAYRKSIFSCSDMIITGVTVRLEDGEQDKIKARMNELISKRKEKQPLEYPSAGSTFKRPEGSYASLLIEQCGLKGTAVGDAEVSRKHSGFIINKGNATCSDIIKLTEIVKERVYEKTGYKLELEPEILG